MLIVKFEHDGVIQESEVFHISVIPVQVKSALSIAGANPGATNYGLQCTILVCSASGEMIFKDLSTCSPIKDCFAKSNILQKVVKS